MNIIIVAGGNGTRFNELSCFPKILLPTATDDSVLSEHLKYFNGEDRIFLIINHKFYSMVENYLSVNMIGNVTLIESFNSCGSYNTIASVLDMLPDEDLLFMWSDILLEGKKFPEFDRCKNVIFVSDQPKYRYEYRGGKISKVEKSYSGNIPGIYYLKDKRDVFVYPASTDADRGLADRLSEECAANPDNYKSVEIRGIYEFKDYDTYVEFIKAVPKIESSNRFFNQIRVSDDGKTLYKTAVDPSYYHLIEKEYEWYRKIAGYSIGRVTPSIYGYSNETHTMSMEYLSDYVTLHSFLENENASADEVCDVYENIFKNITRMHAHGMPVEIETFKRDLYKEIVSKTVRRCEKIKGMLLKYDNGELTAALNETYSRLLALESAEVHYVFGHGDLNGSNIMVNPKTLDVKFIDPRGYFGDTGLYTWAPYEYAKLLYCLYGYDEFNLNKKIYTVDRPVKAKWADKIEQLQKPEYRLLVGVIYVALAGYISQDLMKANIAYEHGLELLKNELTHK